MGSGSRGAGWYSTSFVLKEVAGREREMQTSDVKCLLWEIPMGALQKEQLFQLGGSSETL